MKTQIKGERIYPSLGYVRVSGTVNGRYTLSYPRGDDILLALYHQLGAKGFSFPLCKVEVTTL